jgi:hypothetical protein
MMPYVVVQVLEMVIPPLMRAVISHYQKKEQTPETTAKIVAHQSALDILSANAHSKSN